MCMLDKISASQEGRQLAFLGVPSFVSLFFSYFPFWFCFLALILFLCDLFSLYAHLLTISKRLPVITVALSY